MARKQKNPSTNVSVFEVNPFTHARVTARAFKAVVASLLNRYQQRGYEFDFEDYLKENFDSELRTYYSDKFGSR